MRDIFARVNTYMTDAAEERRTDGAFVAFAGGARIASGALADAALAAKRAMAHGAAGPVLVFDSQSGRVVDLDLRGDEADLAARYAPPPANGVKRGRPKLGVIAREVTLLPRHWDWLARQPGGASVTLRRLVEAARKQDADSARERVEAAYRFMVAVAGDLPGFEEAARALFAGDERRLDEHTAAWPPDVRTEVFRFLALDL